MMFIMKDNIQNLIKNYCSGNTYDRISDESLF